MPSKTYTEQFKRDAVALYENSDGASIQKIATDLGINRVTLKNWITKYGAHASTSKNSAATELSVAEENRQLKRKTRSFVKNATSCERLLSISRKRRIGDPLPVR